MVEVVRITAEGDAFEAELKIREGVYRLDAYTVRVERVPLPPAGLQAEEQRRRMVRFVERQITRHLRRGSLPPRATRLDGSAVWEVDDPA
jgi:hypothetical protein